MKIALKNGAGEIAVTLEADYLALSDEDRQFVDEIAGMFRAYERSHAPGTCRAKLHGPKVYADGAGTRCICYVPSDERKPA